MPTPGGVPRDDLLMYTQEQRIPICRVRTIVVREMTSARIVGIRRADNFPQIVWLFVAIYGDLMQIRREVFPKSENNNDAFAPVAPVSWQLEYEVIQDVVRNN